MEKSTDNQPSFSSGQRWAIFFSVIFSIVFLGAILVMLNYLSAHSFKRTSWAREPQNKLSLQTIALLKTVTNKVNVTLYYDKTEGIYSMVDELLQEYHLANPLILVDRVDYLTDNARAQKVKAVYKLNSNEDKNLVIFESEGRRKIISGITLGDYNMEMAPKQSATNEFIRHLRGFNGEKYFSSALLSVVSRKSSKAYFVEGHGEHPLDSETTETDGYKKFGQVLEGNNVSAQSIKLYGTNTIPKDCSLLVIGGPRRVIPPDELAKVRQYLNEGGRLLVLFNYYTVKQNITTGLEALLQEWNVGVGNNVVNDPRSTLNNGAILVSRFSSVSPMVTPMGNSSGLALFNPRSIEAIQPVKSLPGAPEAKALVFSSESATIGDSLVTITNRVPLVASVEKGRVQGVVSERGTTAIVVCGDSSFLNNGCIDIADNRDFAGLTINWLLDQTQMLQGVGTRAVKEYTLTMTETQLSQIRWIFLGAMPGGVLLVGFFVWLRRRN